MVRNAAKFSIIDDDTRMLIGTCNEFVGLAGESIVEIAKEKFHTITLVEFQISESS